MNRDELLFGEEFVFQCDKLHLRRAEKVGS